MPFQPSQKVLERYADVLVNFALGGGAGVQAGRGRADRGARGAKPLYVELHRAVWRAGGHVIGHYMPDDDGDATSRATSTSWPAIEQLDFFPATYMRGMIDEIDHQVSVLSDTDLHALEGSTRRRSCAAAAALKPAMDWRTEKENAGRFSWTLGLYGTPAMAAEAGLSEQEYWEQIIDACFLDESPTRSPAGARSVRRSASTSRA
jgi:aminopeptidase